MPVPVVVVLEAPLSEPQAVSAMAAAVAAAMTPARMINTCIPSRRSSVCEAAGRATGTVLRPYWLTGIDVRQPR